MRYVEIISTLLTLGILGAPLQIASAEDASSDFDAAVASFNEEFSSAVAESQAQIRGIEKEYDLLQKQIEEEYTDFKREVSATWGETEATVSDRYRWVEYGDDRLSRSIVDFESGEVKVEIVVSDNELADEALVAAKIEAARSRLLASKGMSTEYESKYVDRVEMSPTPIMDEIYDIRSTNISRTTTAPQAASKEQPTSHIIYTATLESEIAALRNELARITPTEETPTTTAATTATKTTAATTPPTTNSCEITKVETSAGERKVVSVKSNLKVGYLSDLAKRYESDVIANAERFNLSPSLIFAVMETESYFNPTATSHIPAYGLMQIVPKYAGHDVYKYLYGVDKILSKEYLYQAAKNVEIGAGYLHLLANRYFSGVSDPESRELCVIAAYNTGAGNVSRAMVGHTNVYKSISKINSMGYNELYSYLRKNLPYEETRNYIERVTTKQKRYQAK
ncbi:MAG: murein transglycosylase domain-containing protein [Rikenellaceae bacterium]